MMECSSATRCDHDHIASLWEETARRRATTDEFEPASRIRGQRGELFVAYRSCPNTSCPLSTDRRHVTLAACAKCDVSRRSKMAT